MKPKKNILVKFLSVIMLLLIVISISSTMGSSNLKVIDSIKILCSRIPLLGNLIDTNNINKQYFKIVFDIRLPRILSALLSGVGLSVSGVIFQGIFRNPMADPYVLGISSGATFGVAISFLLPVSGIIFGYGSTMIFALIFALITIMLVFHISMLGNKAHVETMLLTGISMNYLFSALTTLLLVFNRQTLEKVYFWTLGSFSNSSNRYLLTLALVVVICSSILYTQSKSLNVLLVGEKDAQSLGIDIRKLKIISILVTSIMLSVVISICGSIGFVGLIIPHIARFLVGPDHKKLIPMSAIMGGIFLIFCDSIARTLFAPKELSVGIITSLVGVPFFIFLLYKRKRRGQNGR